MGGVAFSSPQKCGVRGALHLIGEVTLSHDMLQTCGLQNFHFELYATAYFNWYLDMLYRF